MALMESSEERGLLSQLLATNLSSAPVCGGLCPRPCRGSLTAPASQGRGEDAGTCVDAWHTLDFRKGHVQASPNPSSPKHGPPSSCLLSAE